MKYDNDLDHTVRFNIILLCREAMHYICVPCYWVISLYWHPNELTCIEITYQRRWLVLLNEFQT
jgi:hypothetical protein